MHQVQSSRGFQPSDSALYYMRSLHNQKKKVHLFFLVFLLTLDDGEALIS